MNQEKSALITEGLRESFRNGTAKVASRVCYGYTHDASGKLVIYGPEAGVVRWIFSRYIAGDSLGKIVDALSEQNIPSPSGKPRWNREGLLKLISNEKYAGIVLLQKTVVKDGKQVKNEDAVSQYIYERNHSPIISGEIYAQAQLARFGRSKVMQRGPVMKMDW